jgi:hypothetical protein
VGHAAQTTKGVNAFSVPWTNSLAQGKVMLIDTEGLSPSNFDVVTHAKQQIKDSGVSEEVLRHRLVFVLVISTAPEGIRLMEDLKTKTTLQAMCEAYRPARIQIVYTKEDIMQCSEQDIIDKCTVPVREWVKAAHKECEVDEPIFVKHNADGKGNVSQVAARLCSIFNGDLMSEKMLKVIRIMLGSDVQRVMHPFVQEGNAHYGLESEDTLARRCAFCILRAFGKRCRKDQWPKHLTFADVADLFEHIKASVPNRAAHQQVVTETDHHHGHISQKHSLLNGK